MTDASDADAQKATGPDHLNAEAGAAPAMPPDDAAAAAPPAEAEVPQERPGAEAAPLLAEAPADAEATGEDPEDPESDALQPEDAEDEDEDEDEDEEPEEEDEPPAIPERARFADLGLSEPILRAVEEAGYLYPTPIQEQAIPVVLMGRDVLGVAQTGTGKTAGFTLPMIEILAAGRAKARMPRSLILEPTRELALQVAENFQKYGKHLKLVHALLIGGESMDEQRAVLEKGVDVLIATPGRLLDLFDRGRILLADVKVLVIDEADRMLDMGFIPDVERIVSFLPRMRQTLFFSATMAPEIRRLADAFLTNPKEITVARPATVATTITTGAVVVRTHDKREALRRLLRREEVQNALIFCNRKRDVDILYKSLSRHGFSVGALHGDMDQSTRFATLNRFKANEIRLLVCSDVAARGLDIGGLSHVFNFDVPFHAEDYVHRIGRTGRAGREGHAYTIVAPEDGKLLQAIEKLTGRPIPRMAVDGLDPVSDQEMEEASSARRGRGRAPARGEPRRDARRPEPRTREDRPARAREDRAPRDARPPREEGAARPTRDERAPRPPREERAFAREDRGQVAAREDRGPATAREDRGYPAGRDDRPYPGARDDRGTRPRDGERATREDAARRRDRDAPPRRDQAPRGGRDDLGPPVRGFGDAVPAFMLIPIPRRRSEPPEPEREAEAA